jgi:hypothetical protein
MFDGLGWLVRKVAGEIVHRFADAGSGHRRTGVGRFAFSNFAGGCFASIPDGPAGSAGASSTFRAAKQRWPSGQA